MPGVSVPTMKSEAICSSRIVATDAFIDEPSIPIALTSATPRVRANAVVAVRVGVRREFSAASLPIAPNGQPTTRPMRGTTGREAAGEARNTPTNTATAPIPTTMARSRVSSESHATPTTAAATPAASTAAPATVRALSEPRAPAADALIAATGGTEPARRAGAHAESTVTRTPTTTGTTSPVAVMPSPPPTPSTPRADIAATMRATSPMPSPTPSAEPTRPSTTASPTTEPVICRLEAPSARNSANSRVRCETVMAKVLAMRNVPTNRPTPPKATRK